MDYIAILDKLISVVVGILNVVGATKTVSDILAKQITEGRTTWTPEERKTITDALEAAKATADAQIRAAGG